METSPGQRLRQWREFKKLTLAQLSEASGVKVTTLSTSEQPGASNPSYDTITKVLAAYPDLNPDWLLMGTGPMLRDGRALAPVAVPLARPDATATTTMALNRPTPEEYRQLQEENRQLREQLAAQSGKLVAVEDERTRLFTELIKKPEASADAASLFDTVDQIAAEYQIAPCELPAIQRFRPRPAPRMVIGGFGQSVA